MKSGKLSWCKTELLDFNDTFFTISETKSDCEQLFNKFQL